MRLFLLNFIAILLVSTQLNANEHFLLPEQKSALIESLKSKIERAHTLRIVTQILEHSQLSKSIEKKLLKGGVFELVVADVKSAAYYAKYKNSTVYIPSNTDLFENFTLNILIIDQSDVCFSSLPFNSATLQRKIGHVACTTNPEDVSFALDAFKRFKARFERY